MSWFAKGTAPGDPGPAVILGHVDTRSGPDVFYRLHELSKGDKITVKSPAVEVLWPVCRGTGTRAMCARL